MAPSYSPLGRDRTAWRAGFSGDLVRKLSRDTARTYGLDDRGTIEKGMLAA